MRQSRLLILTLCTLLTTVTFADDLSIPANKKGFGLDPSLRAGTDFVAGDVIVGLSTKGQPEGVVNAAQAMQGRLGKKMGDESAVLLHFGNEQAAQAAINALVVRRDVQFVERNGFARIPPPPDLNDIRPRKSVQSTANLRPTSISTDPGTGFQWHHTVIRKTAALPVLSATPPTVAVIDTGVDYTHPDLADQVIKGKNVVANSFDPYDDYGHGTHVAGIIAAKSANDSYGEGVCPNCKILAVKVVNSGGWGTWFDIADGMAWVVSVQGNPTYGSPKVVNMSLGVGASTLISTQVAAMKDAGMILVASAGNDNTTDPLYSYPGGDPNTALRVMATEQHDCRAWFSNFSPSTDPGQYNIAAPGWNISSTAPEYGYAQYSGTSMAAPMVAGAAALVWGQFPRLSRDDLVSRLVTTGRRIGCGFATPTRRVDVRKAIDGTSETAAIGRLLDPFTGKAPAPNTTAANAKLYHGETLVKRNATNKGGFYEMTGLTAGQRILKAARNGSMSNVALRGLKVNAGVVTFPSTDALPMTRPVGNATITLDWKNTQPIIDTTGCGTDCNGWDFDLFVKRPDDDYTNYGNPGALSGAPYVFFPRDSSGDLEPLETIVVGESALLGIYKVFVHPYSGKSWARSAASIQLYNGAKPLGGLLSPPATCGLNQYWYVGDLDKTSSTAYTWTPKNTCSDVNP